MKLYVPVKSVSHKKPVIIEIGIGKIYDFTAKTHVFKSEKMKKVYFTMIDKEKRIYSHDVIFICIIHLKLVHRWMGVKPLKKDTAIN